MAEPFWGELVQTARTVNFRKGSTLYHQGFPAEGIFLLSQGSMKLTTVSEAGIERISAFVMCGELFGVDCLSAQPIRCQSAVARERSQTLFISTAQFHKALHTQPDLLWKFALMLNNMVLRAAQDKLAITGSRVHERIASVLLDLAARTRLAITGSPVHERLESVVLDVTEKAKDSPIAWKPAFAPVTQRELAELLGVPEETICREIRAMRPSTKRALALTNVVRRRNLHSAGYKNGRSF
jgi:CRP-like cAMP-binding protein